MYQALKDWYKLKKTKDVVRTTTKLEKCYIKSDLDDRHPWIMEMEQLNREGEMQKWNKEQLWEDGSKDFGKIAQKGTNL